MPSAQKKPDLIDSFQHQLALLLSLLPADNKLYDLAPCDSRHHAEAGRVSRATLGFVSFTQRKDVERAYHFNEILVTDAVRKCGAHKGTQRLLDSLEKRLTLVINIRPWLQVLPLVKHKPIRTLHYLLVSPYVNEIG